jgi:hypothetical protein
MLIVGILWAASLFVVGTIVRAQDYRTNPLPEPRVISGADFGIRVEGERKGVPIGPLVVRINGQWVEAHIGSVNRSIGP